MPRTTRKSSEQLEVPAAQKRARPGRPPALNHEDCAFILHKLRLWQVRDPLWIHHEPGHAKAEALAAALRDQRGVKVKQRTIYNLCFATGAQQIPDATVTPRKVLRARIKAANVQERRCLTDAEAVGAMRSRLEKLLSTDSTFVTVCISSGEISAKAATGGPGPHIKVHLYGAIALGPTGAGARSPLVFVRPNVKGDKGFDGEEYLDKVVPMIKAFAATACPDGDAYVLQDGAPQHKATVLRPLHAVPHPAQSPDLNPIEYMWVQMADMLDGLRVDTGGSRASAEAALKAVVAAAWADVAASKVCELVHALPAAMEAVHNAPGRLHETRHPIGPARGGVPS